MCGGGNLGHTFAAVLGSHNNLIVNLLTGHPDQWRNQISGISEDESLYHGTLHKISDKPADVVPEADLILISLPCFAREEMLIKIAPCISQSTIIGCLPGNGNFELQARTHLPINEKKLTLFGSLRIPYICRLNEYGTSVKFHKKECIQIKATSSDTFYSIKDFFSRYMGIEVEELHNFLELVLSNSNPILHPSRLFDLFGTEPFKGSEEMIPFYETWTTHASEILMQMDAELFKLINQIPLNLSGVTPLLTHYESTDATSLTKKIKSIKAFKGIGSPMTFDGKLWHPDYTSRYFTEDIPYGLLIIKSLLIIYNLKSPIIDQIIEWVQPHLRLKLITTKGELDQDAHQFPIFQKYCINEIDQVESHFS
ncbi:hypothetical protein DMA11_02340 [Marinilabiliaceae bacterium JC017]|nr:hypothetical protein DMA11_02340 [Marinilabiliaceae bacterium JC017]